MIRHLLLSIIYFQRFQLFFSALSFVSFFLLTHRIISRINKCFVLRARLRCSVANILGFQGKGFCCATPLFVLIVFKTGVQGTALTRGVIDNNGRNSISPRRYYTHLSFAIFYIYIYTVRPLVQAPTNYVNVQCVPRFAIPSQ